MTLTHDKIQRLLTEAYGDYLDNLARQGWQNSYISITFAHYCVPRDHRLSVMVSVIESQLYPWLLKKLERHPGRKSRFPYLPRLVLFGDLPVFKHRKVSSRRVVNDGAHLNGFLSVSSRHEPFEEEDPDAVTLLRRYPRLFPSSHIYNIHVEPLQHDSRHVVDYARKTINAGRLNGDATLVLPRPWRPKRKDVPEDPEERAVKDIQAQLNLSREAALQVSRSRSKAVK